MLTAVSGCALTGEAAATPDVSASTETSLIPVVDPDERLPAGLVKKFPDDAPQQPLCGDPLLGRDFSLDESGLPTLYVDAASAAAAPDGTIAAPFHTLSEALLADVGEPSDSSRAPGPTRRVLVASGHYDEDVAIPPGTLLAGGYDAQSWEEGTAASVIGGIVYVGTATALAGIVDANGSLFTHASSSPPSPSTVPLTVLMHFEVSSGLEVVPGARALLRDNVISPVFFGAAYDAPSALRAMAVWVDAATVRAEHNQLRVPVSDPTSVISSGIFTWDSCAWVTENVISDYRTPISLSGGAGVAATFNIMERAENGVGVSRNRALIAANSVHAQRLGGGCVYAITMSQDAHPDIRDNEIYLADLGNRGILEEDVASRPNALVGNRFSSSQTEPVLYIDHRGAVDLELLTNVGAVNAIAGVPTIGRNTFDFVATRLD